MLLLWPIALLPATRGPSIAPSNCPLLPSLSFAPPHPIMADWVEVVPTHRGRTSRKRGHSSDDDGGDAVVYSSPSRQIPSRDFRPFVLILVGIPGSGKSVFASRLETSMPAKFVRVNQDSLKTRKKCESAARKALAEGKVAVIDRCNFNLDQRKTWVDLANNANVHCECIVFDYQNAVCITRCQQRRGHETLHPSKAAGVVSLVAKQFRPPIPRQRNGGEVQCSGGEQFRRLERVTSFIMADDLAERYLE